MKKPFTAEEFLEIYSKVPRVCVDLVVQHEGKTLLTKRAIPPYKNMYHFPGGTVFLGESIPDAAKRVAKAELGIVPVIMRVAGVMELIKDPLGQHAISVVVLCVTDNLSITLNNEANDFAFFREIPSKIIKEHGDFLREHNLCKT